MARESALPLTAAILADVAAAQVIVVQPAYIAALVEHAGLPPDDAGYVLSLEMTAFALATIAMVFVVSRVRWRPVLAGALAGLCLAHAASAALVGTDAFVAARVLAGLCAGVIVPLAFAAVGLGPRPERAFGVLIAVVLLYGAALLGAAPAILALGGLPAMLGTFAAVAALGLLLARWIPEPSRPDGGPAPPRGDGSRRLEFAALAAMGCYFAAQSGFWAYCSLIGRHYGLEDRFVATALSLSQFAGVAGALVPALLADRKGQVGPLTIGVLSGVVPLALLAAAPGAALFAATVAIFQFGWNMTHPYLLGVFARFDRTGRVVVYGTAMQKIGLAAGPALAAAFVAGGHYVKVLALSMGLGFAAILLVLPAARAQARPAFGT